MPPFLVPLKPPDDWRREISCEFEASVQVEPCVPLLPLRRLLLGGRAQTLLCHLLQLQPVHPAGGKRDRPGHRAVRGVHVAAGQSGKFYVGFTFC